MPRFVAVSRERHEQEKVAALRELCFAAADALAPVVGAELAKAALSMPLAFSEQSGRYPLVAVLSLTPGATCLSAPDGRWLGALCSGLVSRLPVSLVSTARNRQTRSMRR